MKPYLILIFTDSLGQEAPASKVYEHLEACVVKIMVFVDPCFIGAPLKSPSLVPRPNKSQSCTVPVLQVGRPRLHGFLWNLQGDE